MNVMKTAAIFLWGVVASTSTVATVSAQSFTAAETEEILVSGTMTAEEIAELEQFVRMRRVPSTAFYDLAEQASENYKSFLELSEATVGQLAREENWRDSSGDKQSVENYEVAKDDARAITGEHVKTLRRLINQAQARPASSHFGAPELETAVMNARFALVGIKISAASTSSQDGRVELKSRDDAKPFVFARAPAKMKKSYEKVFDNYFNDEVDFFFESWNCDLRIIVACNPATRKWTVWSEFVNLNLIDDAEINFCNLTDGPVFEGKFDDEDKMQHVRVMKNKIEKIKERERKLQRNAERGARASSRNAGKKAQQNALIMESLKFNSRGSR